MDKILIKIVYTRIVNYKNALTCKVVIKLKTLAPYGLNVEE